MLKRSEQQVRMVERDGLNLSHEDYYSEITIEGITQQAEEEVVRMEQQIANFIVHAEQEGEVGVDSVQEMRRLQEEVQKLQRSFVARLGEIVRHPLQEMRKLTSKESRPENEKLKKEIEDFFDIKQDVEAWAARFSGRVPESYSPIDERTAWLEVGFEQEQLQSFKEAAQKFARHDLPEALRLLARQTKKNTANSHVALFLCEAITKVVAEVNPVEAKKIFDQFNKKRSNNAYLNSKINWIDRVATPKNIDAIIKSVEAGEIYVGGSEEGRLYAKAIRQSLLGDSMEKVLALWRTQKFGLSTDRQETENVKRLTVDHYLRSTTFSETEPPDQEKLIQAYELLQMEYYRTASSPYVGEKNELTREQVAHLERVIKLQTERLSTEQIFFLTHQVEGDARDRVLEDWAIKTCVSNCAEVMAVIKKEYGKEVEDKDGTRARYQARLFSELRGVVRAPMDRERLENEVNAAESNYITSASGTAPFLLWRDSRMISRHPEIALQLIEEGQARGVGRVRSGEKDIRSEAVVRLLEINQETAVPQVVEYLQQGVEIQATRDILAAIARFNPEQAFEMLERYTAGSQGDVQAVVSRMPPEKILPLTSFVIDRGRDAVTRTFLKYFLTSENYYKYLVPHLHTFPERWQKECVGFFDRDAMDPPKAWLRLVNAESSIQEMYIEQLASALHYSRERVVEVLHAPSLRTLRPLLDGGAQADKLFSLALAQSDRAEKLLSLVERGINENKELTAESIIESFAKNPGSEDEILLFLQSEEMKNFKVKWLVPTYRSVTEWVLGHFEKRSEILQFFEAAEFTQVGLSLGEARVSSMVEVFTRRGFENFEKHKLRFLELLGSEQIKRVFAEFSKYADQLSAFLAKDLEVSWKFYQKLQQCTSKAEFFAELVGFCPDAFNVCVADFTEDEGVELINVMDAHKVSWEMIALIKTSDWAGKSRVLAERSKEMVGSYRGAAVVDDSLRKSLKTKELFESNQKHLVGLQNKLRTLQYYGNILFASNKTSGWGAKTEQDRKSEERSVEFIVGGQEAIANKNLRNRLESSYFEAPVMVDGEYVERLPDRMRASLGLLVGKYKLEPVTLNWLADTLYSGKAFKSQSNIDQFNYFLLEGQEAVPQVREFIQLGLPLMEISKEAKRLLFQVTQLMRSFAAIESSLAPRLQQVVDELREFGEEAGLFSAPPELRNPLEIARYGEKHEKAVVDKLGSMINDLNKSLVDSFNEKSGVALTLEQTKAFFEKFDNAGLIFVYLGKLSKYPEQKKLFQNFIKSVALNEFPEIRYTLDRTHLDKVFARRTADESVWRKNISFNENVGEMVSPAETLRQRVQDIIGGALYDHHMPDAIQNAIQEFVDANEEEKARIIGRVRYEISNLLLALKLATVGDDAKNQKMKEGIRKSLGEEGMVEVELTERAYTVEGMPPLQDTVKTLETTLRLMLLLQSRAEDYVSGQINSPKEGGGKRKQLLISEVIKDLQEKFPSGTSEFAADIKGIAGALEAYYATQGAEPQLAGKLIAEESEDPDLLLRLGTDVESSCQNVNGSPDLNRNLVSYIMDGKTKVLFVRDPDGAIVGRSIMRLLYDEKRKLPVIHLERSYHRSGSPVETVNGMLLALATAKAKSLKYPLVVSGRFSSNEILEPYPNSILSYGGPGNTEYVDNLGGSQQDQKYTIQSSQISEVQIR